MYCVQRHKAFIKCQYRPAKSPKISANGFYGDKEFPQKVRKTKLQLIRTTKI